MAQDGSALDLVDNTSVVNNLLLSLFSQCSVCLNAVSVSSSKDLYNYRATSRHYSPMGMTPRRLISPALCGIPVERDFLAYQEFVAGIQIDRLRNVTTDF